MLKKERPHVFVIGITGKMAAGKTTVAHLFREMNIPVFDADLEARKLQENDLFVQKKIKAQFPSVFLSESKIDRAALRLEVLKNESALSEMENIIFPQVKKKAVFFIEENQNQDFVVLDVPLMWGSGVHMLCHDILYLECSDIVRQKRISQRGFFSQEERDLIEERQKLEEKCLTQDIFRLKGDISLEEIKSLLHLYLRKKA